jgi:hypothetical protein
MQVQRIQNNNNYNTNFGTKLKINNSSRKMEKPIIKYLEKEFPKRTKDARGKLELNLNQDIGFTNSDSLHYTNKGFHDSIVIDRVDLLSETKENLLDKLVNSLAGFMIREKAQNKINMLKEIILETADKAYYESANAFKKKNALPVVDTSSPSTNIAMKDDTLKILKYIP